MGQICSKEEYAQYRDKNCHVVANLEKDQMIIAGIIALLNKTTTRKGVILDAVKDTLHLRDNFMYRKEE
ncbi:MAG: hypothetical protein HQK98_06870 [Nitrospirae bacterium]|nr:hypothetical protein [Nitrospirota bacterium]